MPYQRYNRVNVRAQARVERLTRDADARRAVAEAYRENGERPPTLLRRLATLLRRK